MDAVVKYVGFELCLNDVFQENDDIGNELRQSIRAVTDIEVEVL